jgi:hypothetical protein
MNIAVKTLAIPPMWPAGAVHLSVRSHGIAAYWSTGHEPEVFDVSSHAPPCRKK